MNDTERNKRAAAIRVRTIDTLAKLASAGAGATVSLGFLSEGVPAENLADTISALSDMLDGMGGTLLDLAIELRELRDGGAS